MTEYSKQGAAPPQAVTFDITPEKRATQLAFLKRQLFQKTAPVTRDEVDLAGKTAIVTGSNQGLGLECSRQLMDIGLSKLILAVRSESKGEEARRQLLKGRSPDQTIEVWKVDFSDYDSVIQFAERTKTLDRLDIVVHNAGVSKATLQLNPKTGFDESIQINYLCSVLFIILLLPVLKEKNTPEKPGRISLVSSETAAWAAFKERTSDPLLDAFKKEEGFVNNDRYWTSKLLGQLWLSEFAQRVAPSVAVVNAPNPGLCYGTNLTNEYNGTVFGFIFNIITRTIGRSSSEGARVFTDAAVRHGQKSHGQYVEDGKLQP
jgi:NAD(P)-dependent dehydrogenase (short-subunit alcohol dehydrogenase family)